MQTYSHLLLTALGQKKAQQAGVPVHAQAMLIGSVLPDIPFFLLTLLGQLYYSWFAATPTGESPMVYMHTTLYFTDPLWLASHNLFHAPLILAGIALVGFLATRRNSKWGRVLFWFAISAGFHSFLDIFTHFDDGPLLLFPLNWSWRFASPVSYWDPNHYGWIFAPLEHLLDLAILIYLIWAWRGARRMDRIKRTIG